MAMAKDLRSVPLRLKIENLILTGMHIQMFMPHSRFKEDWCIFRPSGEDDLGDGNMECCYDELYGRALDAVLYVMDA